MRKLSIVTTILAALMLTAASAAPPCAACTCVRNPQEALADAVPQAYEAASGVFSGVVIRERSVTLNEALAGAEPFDVRYDVIVETSWKGPSVRDTVVVTSSGQSSMCGADLRRGYRYLLYAGGTAPDKLTASGCSRTALLSSVEPEELRLLGRLGSSSARTSGAAAGAEP